MYSQTSYHMHNLLFAESNIKSASSRECHFPVMPLTARILKDEEIQRKIQDLLAKCYVHEILSPCAIPTILVIEE
jgi:hypothetical protein